MQLPCHSSVNDACACTLAFLYIFFYPSTPLFLSAFDENMTQGCSNMVFAPLKSPFDCFKACCPGSGYHPDCRVRHPRHPRHYDTLTPTAFDSRRTLMECVLRPSHVTRAAVPPSAFPTLRGPCHCHQQRHLEVGSQAIQRSIHADVRNSDVTHHKSCRCGSLQNRNGCRTVHASTAATSALPIRSALATASSLQVSSGAAGGRARHFRHSQQECTLGLALTTAGGSF